MSDMFYIIQYTKHAKTPFADGRVTVLEYPYFVFEDVGRLAFCQGILQVPLVVNAVSP